MQHYLYDKSDIILSKTNEFTIFSMQVSVWQQSVLRVTSSALWHVRVHSAGTTYFSENYFKAMFSFHGISVLFISVTFYTYLANIVFSATWSLKLQQHCGFKKVGGIEKVAFFPTVSCKFPTEDITVALNSNSAPKFTPNEALLA